MGWKPFMTHTRGTRARAKTFHPAITAIIDSSGPNGIRAPTFGKQEGRSTKVRPYLYLVRDKFPHIVKPYLRYTSTHITMMKRQTTEVVLSECRLAGLNRLGGVTSPDF